MFCLTVISADIESLVFFFLFYFFFVYYRRPFDFYSYLFLFYQYVSEYENNIIFDCPLKLSCPTVINSVIAVKFILSLLQNESNCF